jgi:hypothetical protein
VTKAARAIRPRKLDVVYSPPAELNGLHVDG